MMDALHTGIIPINEIQRKYVFCPSRFSCWDGGVWTGKTAGLVLRAHLLSVLYPGNRGAIFRYTEEDLLKTVKASFRELIDPEFYNPKLGGRDVENLTRYINGSEILWMHLKEISMKSLMSLQVGWFGISQAEECEAATYEMLEGRLRRKPPGWPKEKHFPQYGFIECNRDGKNWIYYKFNPDHNRNPQNYAYFFTRTSDNGAQMQRENPDYYKSLLAKPESWKRRYFYADLNFSEGAWHREFSRRQHCYYPPGSERLATFNPNQVAATGFDPFRCRKIRSVYAFYDYGLSAETAMVWVAVDSEGFRWFFREWYGIKSTIREHAGQLLDAESKIGDPVIARYADPSIFYFSRKDQETALQSGALSIADEYAQHGLTLLPANNDQATGFETIEEALRVNPERQNPLTGKMGSPQWFFSMECPNLVEQIESQRRKSQKNPLTGEMEYVDKRSERIPDHTYDCVIYSANMKLDYVPWQGTMPRIIQRYVH